MKVKYKRMSIFIFENLKIAMEVITIGIVPQSWKIRYSHTGLLVRDISYNCQ